MMLLAPMVDVTDTADEDPNENHSKIQRQQRQQRRQLWIRTLIMVIIFVVFVTVTATATVPYGGWWWWSSSSSSPPPWTTMSMTTTPASLAAVGAGGGDGGGVVTTTTTTTTTNRRNISQRTESSINKSKDETNDTANGSWWLQEDTRLARIVSEWDQVVRKYKRQPGVVTTTMTMIMMEIDPHALELTSQLQNATKALLHHRYGYGVHDVNGGDDDNVDIIPTTTSTTTTTTTTRTTTRTNSAIRVVVTVRLPDSAMVASKTDGHPPQDQEKRIILQLGPPSLIPCSVFYFLELARTYQSGSIHRNANHVLQANAQSTATKGQCMPFQEYSGEFPHKQYTAGYAGRPSGPGWYVSIRDNTRNHGPGSQQEANPHEADALFGTVVDVPSLDVVNKIRAIPEKGWLSPQNKVLIPRKCSH